MLEQFARAVLPAQGHYRVVRLHIPGQRKAQHVWTDTLDDAIRSMKDFAGDTRVYFGTASYTKSGAGLADNVLLNKALRLDIDAGAAKFAKHGDEVYKTRRDALADIKRFSAETGLKPSYIVSSGEGWHVYYALAEALVPEEWHHLASRLFDLCQAEGVRVDHTTTTDVTRLLRVPGGMHDNGNEVTIAAGTGHCYTMQELDVLLPARPRFTASDLSANEAFGASDEREYPPASARKMLELCPELLPVMAKRGDVQEPLWRAMLGLLKHTVEGEKLAHAWSSGYEAYDEEETQRKLDGWQVGPPSMEELAKYVPALRNSPYWGKVTSPLQLGVLSDEEQEELPQEKKPATAALPPTPSGHAWDGHLPPNTRIDSIGDDKFLLLYALKQTQTTADGGKTTVNVWVPVTNTVFWFIRWGESMNDEAARAMMHCWSSGRVVRHELDQSVLASPADLIKYLASKAIHISTHPMAPRAVFQYAKSQFAETQKMKHDLTVTDRFGLRILDDGSLAAIHGRYAIFPDGTIHDTMLGRQLREQSEAYALPLRTGSDLQDSWGVEVWKRDIMPAAQTYVAFLKKHFGKDEYRCYQLAIMAAIASPLMPFVTGEFRGERLPGMCSLNLSLYSRKGGYGKTAACQAGAIAYGHPSMLVSGQGASAATVNSRFKRLAVSGTMPNIMDEMGSLTAHQTYVMLSTVANGADKGRLRQDGSLRPTSPWALVNLITTNRSLHELLQSPGADKTDAVQRRILEIDVAGVPMHGAEARAEYALDYGRVAAESAGALGAVMHLLICKQGLDGTHKLVLDAVTKAAELLGAGQSDRFLYRGLGAILTAGQMLDHVGLMPFSAREVAEEYKACYLKSVATIEEARVTFEPLQLLSRALSDMLPYTLVTEEEASTSKLTPALNERMPMEVRARNIRSEGYTYISSNALKSWASQERVSVNEIIAAAESHGVLMTHNCSGNRKAVRKDLSGGIPGSTGQRTYAYQVSIRALDSYLDEVLGLKTQHPDGSNVIALTKRTPAAPSGGASTQRSDSTKAGA